MAPHVGPWAYFISVGKFKGLKRGWGARGWQIWRSGTVVITQWGPIQLDRRNMYWAAKCIRKEEKFSTERAAVEARTARIHQKVTGTLGSRDSVYQRLPRGQRILPNRR